MPTPRMLMKVERLKVLIATDGAMRWMSLTTLTPCSASVSPEKIEAEIGPSCASCSRRSAVITTRVAASSDGCEAGGAEVACAAAAGARASASAAKPTPETPLNIKRPSLLDMIDLPYAPAQTAGCLLDISNI